MYPIWKCADVLGGVVAFDNGFLVWSATDIYKISDAGLELRRWQIHFPLELSDVCGAPAVSADGSAWLFVSKRGFVTPVGSVARPDDAGTDARVVKQQATRAVTDDPAFFDGALCAVDEHHIATRALLYNVETEEVQRHGMHGIFGATRYKGALTAWGSFGLHVGKRIVSTAPVARVWPVQQGLWYEECLADSGELDPAGVDSPADAKSADAAKLGIKHFWSGIASSSRVMDIAAVSAQCMVHRDAAAGMIAVDDVLGALSATYGVGGCTNYRYFESFARDYALAISRTRVVAGILGGGREIVLYDEATRAQQASIFCGIAAKMLLLVGVLIFVFSIFFS